ncbi:hypothetical protein G4B88_011169 [Cannabis sativa]|uniref:INO80 complex subunit B-like conserved region domain-containing protein n=1 Tax=Cannabis sativa TaxID=3483 RepID=A0A7J6E6P9_CANSA|nr:hypothetical protein G4B88_011169 [Cannabis sativa]
MEGFGGLGVSDGNSAVRKKRSNASRRPRNESAMPLDYREHSSLSDGSKGSSDEDNGYGAVTRKKEMNLNLCSSRASFFNNAESESSKNVIKNEDGGLLDSDEASNNGSFRGSSNEQKHNGIDSKRCSKGVLAPANWTSSTNVGHFESISDDLDNENKVKKVKLKVCGVTRTIHANSISDGASAVGSSTTKSSHVSYAPRPRQKIIQDSADNHTFTSDKGTDLYRRLCKDSRNVINAGKDDSPGPEDNIYAKEIGKYEPVYKSKRVTRRRFIDDALDEEEDNSLEVQYLEKLRTSRTASDYDEEYKDDEERDSRKHRRISKVLKRSSDRQYDLDMGDYGSSRLRRDAKKSRSGRISDDTDYVEEEYSISDDEPNSKRRKPRRESINSIVDNKKEMTVTTRQRALQTGKDVSSSLDANLIEFPNGLPPAPPRKQKEKLTDVEQQLKKAEAAQRRRMQVEKAARESEAEAIRKILGQDSSRKKKEDKIKKRQEDRAQERAANSMIIASDSVRWVLGPSGTVVTFPNEMGLPTIFNSKPCNYPPPREKCAGPSCTNSYKYRDSESKLPLCSLQCYKADFQGILSDLQDWELSFKDKDKKMKAQDSRKELSVSSSKKTEMDGKDRKPAGHSSTMDYLSSSTPYDYLRNYDTITRLPNSSISDDSFADAASEKESGNEYFKQKKFKEAIDCYSRSIALSPTAVAYANRAMAYLKDAENDCIEALNMDDRYIKAYSRRATARKELGKLKECLEDAEFALRLEPQNQEIKKQYTEAKSLYEKVSISSSANVACSLILHKTSTALGNTIEKMQKVEKKDAKVNNHIVQPVTSITQKTEKPVSHNYIKPVTSTIQKTEVSEAQDYTKASLLKAISPEALPQIFKNALTVPVLVDIVKCIASFFREEMDLAVSFLENLTKVPRFNILVMCLTSTDKSDLFKIWNEVFSSEATPLEYAEKLDSMQLPSGGGCDLKSLKLTNDSTYTVL